MIELNTMRRLNTWHRIFACAISPASRGNACRRMIGAATIAVMCSLLPACAATTTANKPDEAYVKEAWAYFRKKCETEAGEKIYKTFAGVKSVLVVKPLPPATEKDLYDQFWYGDPYSNATPWDRRGEDMGSTLIGRQAFTDGRGEIGFEFFEQKATGNRGDEVQRIEPSKMPPYFVSKFSIEKPTSRFGISWEDISKPEDRKYWVAASPA